MKCTFNSRITNQDTICMSLYKRIFPVWGERGDKKTIILKKNEKSSSNQNKIHVDKTIPTKIIYENNKPINTLLSTTIHTEQNHLQDID